MRLISFSLLFILSFFSIGQNLRCKWVHPTKKGVILDTSLIEPGSITTQPVVKFSFDLKTKLFFFEGGDSVLVCYRILASDIFPVLRNRDISKYDPTQLDEPNLDYINTKKNSTLFDFGYEINKSGFISRGITIGKSFKICLLILL